MQCYEKNKGWATCKKFCAPRVDKTDKTSKFGSEPWSCEKLGPMWTITTTTSTPTRTFGYPSLYCIAVSRAWGYEPELLTYQLKHQSGIFGCDLYDVYSTDKLTLDAGFVTLKALNFQNAAVGMSKDG